MPRAIGAMFGGLVTERWSASKKYTQVMMRLVVEWTIGQSWRHEATSLYEGGQSSWFPS